MYIVPGMIDLGLREGKKWPNKVYKKVAMKIALCNPNVKTRDLLTRIVDCILKVPVKRICKISYQELVKKFDMPDVGMYE